MFGYKNMFGYKSICLGNKSMCLGIKSSVWEAKYDRYNVYIVILSYNNAI